MISYLIKKTNKIMGIFYDKNSTVFYVYQIKLQYELRKFFIVCFIKIF